MRRNGKNLTGIRKSYAAGLWKREELAGIKHKVLAAKVKQV